MRLCKVWLLAVLAIAGFGIATTSASAEPAAAAVKRYMAATKIDCHDWNTRKTRKCPLSKSGSVAAIAQGQFPGDDARYAVAFIDHEDGDGGNMVLRMVAVFIEENGRFRFVRRLDEGYGQEPRDFAFLAGGTLEYTATTPRDGDPRCCPTGTEKMRLAVTPSTPAAAAPVAPKAAQGTIEGPFGYPSDYIPPSLEACAENLESRHTYCNSVHIRLKGKRPETGFRIQVPAGRYHVYATRPPRDSSFRPDYRAYYSQFVLCGYTANCPSHEPIEVTVEAGKITRGVDPSDWYVD